MIKTLLTGAALGFIGKKLYDEGKLDSAIDTAREKLRESFPQASGATASHAATAHKATTN